MNLKIVPAVKLRGEVTVPGDKSISHRVAILGALAHGVTEVTGFLEGDDCLSTLRCLESLGVKIERFSDGMEKLKIYGEGLHSLAEPEDLLDAGNSGTTMRMLLGVLAGLKGHAVLTGDASLRKRPMKRVVEPLKQMGALIYGRKGGEFAPLAIEGGSLRPLNYHSPVASAQVKSAVLLAGLFAKGTTAVTEPFCSRDHTERMLYAFGGKVERRGLTVQVTGSPCLKAQYVRVPGDLSAAAFFLVAASIVPASEVMLRNVGTNPTRTGILEVLKKMGAEIVLSGARTLAGEPVADLFVKNSKLKAITVGGEIIPRVIDELPVVAVAATQAQGETVIRDAAELRVKESDRISAVVQELRRMGAQIRELPDGMVVEGPVRLKGTEVDAHGDHRLAMALAVAGLVAHGETVVHGAESINISFPEFIGSLQNLLDV